MIASAAGTTNRIFATASPRRPPRKRAGAEEVDGTSVCVAVSRVFESDIRRLLIRPVGRSAAGLGAGLGHGVGRSGLAGQDQLHAGVDDLGGVRPLVAELAGPG